MNKELTKDLLKSTRMEGLLAIASDHAGYIMKIALISYLKEQGFQVKDFGTDSEEAVDYPEFGHPMALAVESGECVLGISLCGSGNGINMVTNKHKGIRGALCWNREISMMARSHNDANVCSIPARYLNLETAKEIVDAFLETEFEGGRHINRIKKIPIEKD